VQQVRVVRQVPVRRRLQLRPRRGRVVAEQEAANVTLDSELKKVCPARRRRTGKFFKRIFEPTEKSAPSATLG
jgi:hypothetical protein